MRAVTRRRTVAELLESRRLLAVGPNLVAQIDPEVAAVHEAPVAVADSYDVTTDGPTTVDAATGLLANDEASDGGPLQALLVHTPEHGVLTFASDGSFTYHPDSGFAGEDLFRYVASDGDRVSSVVDVVLDVRLPAPESVEASDGTIEEGISIEWEIVPFAAVYDLLRGETDIVDEAEVVATDLVDTNYLDSTVPQDESFYYWVVARNTTDTSDPSQPDDGFVGVVPGFAQAIYHRHSGDLQVTVDDVVNWFVISASHGLTGEPIDTAQLAGGLISDNDRLVGETSLESFSYRQANIGPVAAAGLAEGDLSLRFVSELGTPEQHGAVFIRTDRPTGMVEIDASDGSRSDGIEVNWAHAFGAEWYDLYRSTSDFAAAVPIGTAVTDRHFLDTTADPAVFYTYWVLPVNTAGEGELSAPDDGFRALAGPTGLQASDGTSSVSVHLQWDAQPGAISYDILRGTSDNPALASPFVVERTETSFADATGSVGVLYYYWVRANSELGVSELSELDTGFLQVSPPTDVTASDGNVGNGVALTWSFAAAGVPHYRIYRSTTPQLAEAVMIGDAGERTYLDTSAVAGDVYWYWVQSLGAYSTSQFSSSDSGFVAAETPPTVDSVDASDGLFPDSIRVQWGTVPGATSYELLRSDTMAPESAVTVMEQQSVLQYTDSSIVPGVAYYYFVRPHNLAGGGQLGSPDVGFAAVPLPATPVNVDATQGVFGDRIEVTWSNIASADYYQVWRGTSAILEDATLVGDHLTETDFADVDPESREHYYFVRGVNLSGMGPFSTATLGSLDPNGPEKPHDVQASVESASGRVVIRWQAAARTDSYEIWSSFHADFRDPERLVSSLLATEFEETNLSPGQVRYYRVKGVSDTFGPGPFSNVVKATAPQIVLFQKEGEFGGTEPLRDVMPVDIDQDGDHDVIGLIGESGDRVWLNDGTGDFTDRGDSLTLASQRGDVGDINGDGLPDLAIAGVDQVEIWINESGDHFRLQETLNPGILHDVALGDVNADGYLDLYVAGASFDAGDSVWINDGRGRFTDSGQRLNGADSRRVELVDIDGDFDLDAVIANRGTDLANRVWLNDGAGTFTDSGLRIGASRTLALGAADFNGDGRLDLFAANDVDEPNQVFWGQPDGTFIDSGQRLGNDTSFDVALQDFDGDGDIDAYVANRTEPDLLYLNDGAGSFAVGQAFDNFASTGVRFVDIDQNGTWDLVAAHANRPAHVLRNLSPERPYIVDVTRNNGNGDLGSLTSIVVAMSQDVSGSFGVEDLALTARSDGAPIDLSGVTFTDMGSNRYQFDLSALNLTPGWYVVEFDPIGIVNSDGHSLNMPYSSAWQIAHLGDANLDGVVDAADAERLFANWGATEVDGWLSGDFNLDGVVDAADAEMLFTAWGT